MSQSITTTFPTTSSPILPTSPVCPSPAPLGCCPRRLLTTPPRIVGRGKSGSPESRLFCGGMKYWRTRRRRAGPATRGIWTVQCGAVYFYFYFISVLTTRIGPKSISCLSRVLAYHISHTSKLLIYYFD